MPIINRPQTDVERLQAMESAELKANATDPADLAFSAATLARLVAFLPTFRTEMQQRGSALGVQSASTSAVDTAKAKTFMFTNHFIQVFNMGVDREVYTKHERGYFQLDINHGVVPKMTTVQEIKTWAERVITGDPLRVAAGGAAMTNPTAAQVNTQYTAFIAALEDQTTKKSTYDTEQEDVAALRIEADDIIADVWDEVEFTYRKDPPPSKRRKSREYGVAYTLRKGETPSPEDFSLMGKITNLEGTKLDDAIVRVLQTNTIVVSNDKGNYLVPVQTPGTYTIQVIKNGYEIKQITGVVLTAEAVATLNIQLTPITPTSEGIVSGTVTQDGNPYQANLTITVGATTITTHTQLDGSYSLTGVPPGSRVVTCVPDANPADIQTQTTDVPPGGEAEVDFVYA